MGNCMSGGGEAPAREAPKEARREPERRRTPPRASPPPEGRARKCLTHGPHPRGFAQWAPQEREWLKTYGVKGPLSSIAPGTVHHDLGPPLAAGAVPRAGAVPVYPECATSTVPASLKCTTSLPSRVPHKCHQGALSTAALQVRCPVPCAVPLCSPRAKRPPRPRSSGPCSCRAGQQTEHRSWQHKVRSSTVTEWRP